VDGVGGYLVCLDDEIVIGQASPENAVGPNRVDLAIRGDISRRHAVIHRRGESYTIEPLGIVQVNGRRIRDCTLIADGAEIVLGDNVRLRFRQPHPLSASARLEFVSRHRSHPYSDAVLLMAESCVLGAGERNHAVCHDWKQDVVLYREGEELCCRTMQQACTPTRSVSEGPNAPRLRFGLVSPKRDVETTLLFAWIRVRYL
jgi:pSer/pThr/pTyr-binding forkhead associated (FHA) protein